MYITEQYYQYNREEQSAERPRRIRDTRVHVVLYFLAPSGHGLKPLDIEAMRAIGKVANLVPVIAKADSMTLEERAAFKKRVQAELAKEQIDLYPAASDGEYDEAEKAANAKFMSYIPFAVCGAEKTVVIGDKTVRARKFGYGVLEGLPLLLLLFFLFCWLPPFY